MNEVGLTTVTHELVADRGDIISKILDSRRWHHFLIGQLNSDIERRTYTMFSFSDVPDGYCIATVNELTAEKELNEIIKLNAHAEYVRSELGWTNDDFIKNRITAKLYFKFK